MIESEAAVYRRRRAVAVTGVVGVVLLLVWAFSGPRESSSNQPGPELNTAGSTQLSFEPPAPDGVPAAGEPVVAPPSVLPPASVLPAASTLPSASALPSASLPSASARPSARPSKSANPDSDPAPRRAPANAPATVPGAPPQPAVVGACPDRSIGLVAQVAAPSYQVGRKPEFRLVITNTGPSPCSRDLDAGLQEMIVTGANGSRLWSSNDCYPARGSDVRTLQPGKPVVFPVSWAGRTSQPSCAGRRQAVGAGGYQLTGKLGALASAPAPFTLTS